MDELIFRSSQQLENLQIRLNLAAAGTKGLIQQYSQQSKEIALQLWNNSTSTQLKHNLNNLYAILLNFLFEAEKKVVYYVNPRRMLLNIMNMFGTKWTRRDVYFVSLGFICGTFVGVIISVSLRKDSHVSRYMQAIQCQHYLGIESALVVENAQAPFECTEDGVLVDVKAASVHQIDIEICGGYGQTIRRVLGRINKKSDLPVTLGRDCSGIITDIGINVDKRLEVGDEVWLTVPFWEQGTLCQTVSVAANKVGKKPNNIGFESASSLPYSGSLALNALEEAGINSKNARNKRILINGGCTSVGCVLIQILNFWNAKITITCYKRAVPVAEALGCEDIIILNEDKSSLNLENSTTTNTLTKELELRDRFDVIFITTKNCGLSIQDLKYYCKPETTSKVISTVPIRLLSDNITLIGRLLFGTYVQFIYYFQKLLGIKMLSDFDEFHMCYVNLDKLAEFVRNGQIQTVVEKVFHPQDIEIALNHVQSSQAIGSTIVTFR